MSLNPTVHCSQTVPDDWTILFDGEVVGRIHAVVGNPGSSEPWQWSVTLPLAYPGAGTAATLEEAKARWHNAWDELLVRDGPVVIERAIAEARETVERNRRSAETQGPRATLVSTRSIG